MPNEPALRAIAPHRHAYLDNLRSTVIFLVVAMHAAVTYSHFGSWYYKSPEPVGLLSSLVFGLFQSTLQAFFMGLLFLIAGYLTPSAYDHKGFWRFLRDRLVRLGLPTLLYMFVINFTMGHYLLHWHHEGFWLSFQHYVLSGDVVDGTGPLWFAAALLFFSLVYAVVRALMPAFTFQGRKVPHLAGILAVGVVIGGISFFVRTAHPVGTAVHNLQLCNFPQYIVLFAIGIIARRGNWFAQFPTRDGYRLLLGALICGPLLWLALMIVGSCMHIGLDAFGGGWQWPSLAFSIWEQVFCTAICAGLLVFFRTKIDKGGRVSRLMSANSFGIYVFHAPVLVAISLAMANVVMGPLAKTVVVAVIAFVATFAVVHLAIRRLPLLNRII